MKTLFLAALALVPAPVQAANESGIAPWQHPEVVRVDCEEGSGTAFRIGPTTLLSVNHVTSLHQCKIDGSPFAVIASKGDFSVLSGGVPGPWIKINCGGFVAGRKYEAIGFGRGADTQNTVDLEATGEDWNGFQRLIGMFVVVPGQSGGPIVDAETGEVVGTVNVYNYERGDSGSTALKDTQVCNHA